LWSQKKHAEEYLLFPENIGPYLSLDETALSKGELYTILTNKAKGGKKGSIVAIIQGTKASDVITVLKQIPLEKRRIVKEITLDMAGAMNNIARVCFQQASLVIDRFHVHKLVYDAIQEIRIKHRWKALDEENNGTTIVFKNGDTKKQLLARSRYLLFKHYRKWSANQKERALILFSEYPDIEQAYWLAMELSDIYQTCKSKGVAYTNMAQWFNRIEASGFESFRTIRNTFEKHYQSILNYFDNRSTNASAESFNAKIKEFRRAFRGVRDIKFFLYRLTKIYA